jgi:hypothetical protein
MVEIAAGRPVDRVADPPALAFQARERPPHHRLRLSADPVALGAAQLTAGRKHEDPGREHERERERPVARCGSRQRRGDCAQAEGGPGCRAETADQLLAARVAHRANSVPDDAASRDATTHRRVRATALPRRPKVAGNRRSAPNLRDEPMSERHCAGSGLGPVTPWR